MATTFTRMLQRGKTEAEILSSTDVPLAREITTASDTGVFWIGNGVDPASALPKQGPISVDPETGMASLPVGSIVPTVDQTTFLLPAQVRQAMADAIGDPTTPEGAAVAEAGGAGGFTSIAGGSPLDVATRSGDAPGPIDDLNLDGGSASTTDTGTVVDGGSSSSADTGTTYYDGSATS